MRRLLLFTALLVAIPMNASAGGVGHISQCSAFASGTEISMLDSCFEGIAHFAPAGASLTISNDGDFPHTFTAVNGSFDTGELQPDEEFQLILDEPGIYRVFCSLHGTAQGDGMAGVLVVGEPEPEAVAAAFDPSVIEEAIAAVFDPSVVSEMVAAETEPIAEALDQQARAIEDLSETQKGFAASLRQAQLENRKALEVPTAIGTAAPEETSGDLVPMTVGLAAGLALAGLLTVWRLRSARAR